MSNAKRSNLLPSFDAYRAGAVRLALVCWPVAVGFALAWLGR
jgi:hypothetical protein